LAVVVVSASVVEVDVSGAPEVVVVTASVVVVVVVDLPLEQPTTRRGGTRTNTSTSRPSPTTPFFAVAFTMVISFPRSGATVQGTPLLARSVRRGIAEADPGPPRILISDEEVVPSTA
jgi:hypothetical protein